MKRYIRSDSTPSFTYVLYSLDVDGEAEWYEYNSPYDPYEIVWTNYPD